MNPKKPLKLSDQPDENRQAHIVTKAFRRAVEILELSQKDVADILGPSESTISRIFANQGIIPLDKKEGQIALIFLRVFRSLDTLFGGDANNMRVWFQTHNHHLNGTPKDLVRNIGGLSHVAE